MKRIFTAALCAIMMLTMLSAFTVSHASDYYVYMTGDVNVRTGPGLSYASMGTVYQGSTRTATGNCISDNRGVCWYEIYYGNRMGWVSSRYTVLNIAGYYDSYYYDYGCADCVTGVTGDSYVRTGPGLNYDSFGVLDEGETASCTGSESVDSRGVVWYQIYYGGRTGWVSSRYTAKW